MTKENKPRNIQEERLVHEARIVAKSLMNGVPEPLLLLDAQLCIKMVNQVFLETFHLTEEETENKFINEITERKGWSIPRLPGLLEEVLLKNVSIKDVEIQGKFSGLESRILQMSARTIFGEGKRQRILLVLKDITEQKRAEDILHDNAERLSQLIDELLNLSRLESGIAQVNYVPFNMMTLIRQVIENFKTQAGTKHLILTEDTATVLPTIEADPDMCQQVLTNLLDNAVRFAKKQILVRAKVVGSFLQMSIVDDGPGITPQEQKELFTKFTQLHLGLVICKRIVELHHGKIWVESFLGQGSVFQFMLPIKREMTF